MNFITDRLKNIGNKMWRTYTLMGLDKIGEDLNFDQIENYFN